MRLLFVLWALFVVLGIFLSWPSHAGGCITTKIGDSYVTTCW